MPDFEAVEDEDLLIVAATYRERYIDGVTRALREALTDIEAESGARLGVRLARLTNADRIRFAAGEARSTQRLVDLVEEIRRLAKRYREATSERMRSSARELIEVELEFQREFLGGRGAEVAAVTVAAVMAAADARPIQGRRIPDSLREQERNVQRTATVAITDAMVLGLASGAAVGTLLSRRGAIRRHREGAEGFVRTALTSYGAQAASETFAASGIKRYRWLSTLDSRTTPVCMARDQKVYTQGEGPLPPAHFRCRSVVAPLGIGEGLRGTRASRGSSGRQPIENTSFGPWLRRQSRPFVVDTLGPTKAKLFLDGGIKIEKFADIKTGRALTIDELRSRHRAAFDRAGLTRTSTAA